MTRTKSRQHTDICADCGALDPSWASVNKGIFLCIQCCSIHRSLGSHISQVKSLQKGNWCNSQLIMVQTLNNAGVNNIWEFTLESNPKFAKRKPGSKDPLHLKAEFIRAKHQQCAFVYRPTADDGLLCVENELGKELHANVRSSNLETSLRLLIQGADPNYFHDEKGSTPLHVAAKANQITQSELLITYGADPTCPDAQGKTPIDYAKQLVNQELANRLIECRYEVTDKFSNYLCHRKPDHEKGVHFLIPQGSAKSDATATNKLRKLPNNLFEELVMDVYDEVERRETEAIWLSSADTMELNANAVPFLPVNPTLSTTRNQGRQKLGRFTTPELKSLVYDILIDTQRRQLSAEKAQQGNKNSIRQFSQISDDEPLYDSVASDDDYSVIATEEQPEIEKSPSLKPNEVDLLAKRLQASDSTITGLKAEVNSLKTLVERLSYENHELRTKLSHSEIPAAVKVNGTGDHNSYSSVDGLILNDENGLLQYRKSQRPISMYETREGLKTPNWQTLKNQLKKNDSSRSITKSLCGDGKMQTVMQCTEQVTKGIQQLWNCIQNLRQDDYIHCAENIKFVVTNLTAALPPPAKESDTVRQLIESATLLQVECSNLQAAHKNDDTQQINHYLQQVRLCAYEIAKSTKILVTQHPTSSH